MKGKRYLSQLLLICFWLFVGHNLVPHHHHIEAINVPIAGNCPIEHEDHQGTDDHPMHCHAFNSVAFVNYGQAEIQQPVKITSTLTVPVSNTQFEPLSAAEFQRLICLKIPDKSTGYFGAISLRAPPLFSA